MWAREWLGKKIIDLNTGALLGRVIRLVTDEGLMAVRYLVLRPADMRQRLLALPFRHAYPGNPALAALADCQPLAPDTPCWQSWMRQLPLGLPGLSAQEPPAGRCLDAELDADGTVLRLRFASGLTALAAAIACVGPEAVILSHNQPARVAETDTPPPAAGPAVTPPAPEASSPLLGRIITQQLTAPDGTILAQQGQVVDEALIDAATRAQRRVALTVHSRPAQEA